MHQLLRMHLLIHLHLLLHAHVLLHLLLLLHPHLLLDLVLQLQYLHLLMLSLRELRMLKSSPLMRSMPPEPEAVMTPDQSTEQLITLSLASKWLVLLFLWGQREQDPRCRRLLNGSSS